MAKKGLLAFFLLFGVSASILFAQSQYDTNDIKRHLYYLASDELGGRYPETEGSLKASEFLRAEYAKLGLKLLCDDGFQHFRFINGWTSGDSNEAVLNNYKLQIEKDFVPMDYFQTRLASLDAEVVAVWGNISRLPDIVPEFKDRWVMMIENAVCDSLSRSHRVVKLMRAGAAGVLIVADSLLPEIANVYNIPVHKTTNMGPVACISRAIADSLLKNLGETVNSIEHGAKAGSVFPVAYNIQKRLGRSISVTTHFLPTYTNAKNVVACLEGSDPQLKNEIIVVGGHYDHLGTKTRTSRKTGLPVTKIYNGADDNGSGSVGVLELAQKYAAKEDRPKRSVIFVNFDAEELGLIGSQHFFDDTNAINPRNVKAMINLDMIGRYTPEKGLSVIGTNTAKETKELQKKIRKANTGLEKVDFPTSSVLFFGSDHVSYYKHRIPVMFFCTNVHPDYHKPTDTAEKINYRAMSHILQMADALLDNLANRKRNLTFKELEF